ncbi:oxidoreductase [Asticcacaulis sp. AC460]|uniref:Gfo/Idh/MocA family protein n=1 Tax=Asticcacaulis sp. AC460 TaxID=1282360 RepID=UPI0003C40168|nr:Gfo/Idh/MocA family oxidoreductase [Asticcacaulis sp. AC460]ESQ88247.1 oxidoreductase [Asticcacaulis sp. AC460]
MKDFNRRTLLGGALASSAALGVASVKAAPSDTVRVGVIGVKGMGWANMKAHLEVPGVEVVTLCDIDDNVLGPRANEFKTMTGKAPRIERDYRRLLDDKDIDSVIIATPDHWHCLMTVDACSAGKAMYVEKPLGNSIAECQAMVAAKQRHNSVVQVGQWQRSNQHWADAIAFVHSGKLGRVRMAKAWAYLPNAPLLAAKPDAPVPAGVNYDMWLGPAPKRPFNPNRFHYTFRWFWDYGGGTMTDWGVHLMDMAILGMKAGAPKSVMSAGGMYAFPTSAAETPDTQTAFFDYGDFSIQWEHSLAIGNGNYGRQTAVAFIGENGTLVVDRGNWMVVPEKSGETFKMAEVPITPVSDKGLSKHAANLIACIKDRSLKPNCTIEEAANTAIICQMGNIAHRTGSKITWDAARNSFDVAEANKLVTPTYRAPWKLPSRA